VAGTYTDLLLSGSRGTNSITFINAVISIANSLTASASFSSGNYIFTGNTIDYNKAGAQTINAGLNYNNLTISGARGTANITMGSGTIGIAGTFSVTATGTPVYIRTGNTIDYNNTGAQSIAAFSNYNNLTISGARGTATITLSAGTIGLDGNFSVTATGTITYATASNTVVLNGSSQSISAFTFNNLTTNGAGIKTLNGIVTVSGVWRSIQGSLLQR
jgi:fibronectin-binding autotransporter adhesin